MRMFWVYDSAPCLTRLSSLNRHLPVGEVAVFGDRDPLSVMRDPTNGEAQTPSVDIQKLEESKVEASVFRSRIETHREFLEERMDPDFGLLDHLRINKGISFRQFQEISAEKVSYKKCQMIIDSILQGTGPEKIAKFRDALKGTKQEHIVNYVNGDGEYKSQFGGNWPLGEAKVDILDENITFLTLNIDSVSGLLTCMSQKRAITQRQMETISVHQEPCKRNEVLLEIIRRGSQEEFEETIQALRATNQDLIAEVLIHGGMVLSVHSKTESNLPTIGPAEEMIVQQIDEILQEWSPQETRQLLEAYLTLKTSGLIAAIRRRGIKATTASNQGFIADVLNPGGVVLSVHSKADSNLPTIAPAKEEIVQQIDKLLQDMTPEESKLLLETYLNSKNK